MAPSYPSDNPVLTVVVKRAYDRVKKMIKQKRKRDAAFRTIMQGQYWQ